MTFRIEVLPSHHWALRVAEAIALALPATGTVVITGGTTAATIYFAMHHLVERWNGLDVLFSDERCVPPDHVESNYKMAMERFLGRTSARVHRMLGEVEPAEAARRYHDEIKDLIAAGPHLGLFGMGADCHVGALYPGSPALDEPSYAAAVDRPDGMKGITLTPPAMLACRSVRLIAMGEGKAEAVVRVVKGDEAVEKCPARLFAAHPDVTFWLDEGAASLL